VSIYPHAVAVSPEERWRLLAVAAVSASPSHAMGAQVGKNGRQEMQSALNPLNSFPLRVRFGLGARCYPPLDPSEILSLSSRGYTFGPSG